MSFNRIVLHLGGMIWMERKKTLYTVRRDHLTFAIFNFSRSVSPFSTIVHLMSERIQNLYVARLTTNERPCYICNKFTAVVLTLADNSNLDWFYICRSHLGDTNFCSRVGGPAEGNKSVPSSPKTKKQLEDRPPESDSVSDLVASIGSAWNSWRKKPSENEDDKKKDGDDKKKKSDEDDDQKDTKKDTKSDDDDKQESQKETSDSAPASPKSPQQPVRFVLNRDYFYMRQREYSRKIQKKEANNKLKSLHFPEVPKTQPK